MRYSALSFIISLSMLLLTGCEKKSDLAIRFEMEKMLDETDHLQDQAKIKGPVFDDEDFRVLVNGYSAVAGMVSLPGNKSDLEKAGKERQESWSLALLSYTRIGDLYMNRKDFQKAFEYYKKVADNPAATPIQRNAMLNYLALCMEKDKQYQKASAYYDSLALSYFDLAEPLNPNMDALEAPIKSADMWLQTGNIGKFNSKLEQARQYYEKLRKKIPARSFTNVVIGKIAATYLRQNRFNEALTLMKTARNDSTGLVPPFLMLMIADIQMKQTRQYGEAEKTYREFIKAYPDHEIISKVHLGLGLALYQQGRYREARLALKDFDKIPAAANYTIAEAYFLVALCYEKEGEWTRAIGQFDLVQATFAGTDKAFEAGLYVANHYKSKGQSRLAEQAYKEALEYINKYTNPQTNNPFIAARASGYLVKCYTEMGDIDKAIETLIYINDRYPNFTEGKFAPLRLADLYENVLKEPAKAAQWLETFLKNNPDYARSQEVQAHIKRLAKP